jgi:periplasmic protein TonB
MFEDSTFESTGRIKTRSRRWMLAALILNGSILVALVLIPLIYPDALPSHFIPTLLVAPAAPQPETPQPVHQRTAVINHASESAVREFTAPRVIPRSIPDPDRSDQPFAGPNIAIETGPGIPGGDGSPFASGRPITVVRAPAPSVVHLPSKFVEGTLFYKTIPQYPVIAKTTGQQGTVVLQAMISKSGTIENLQVVSGPPMLRQAALDAVKTWRYKPYLLNQQPVEVETTVNVIFKLER